MNLNMLLVAVFMLFLGIVLHQGYLRYILWRGARKLRQLCPDSLLNAVYTNSVMNPSNVLITLFGEPAMAAALGVVQTKKLRLLFGKREVEGTYANGKLVKVEVKLSIRQEKPLHISSVCPMF